jgi:hypothetical protein
MIRAGIAKEVGMGNPTGETIPGPNRPQVKPKAGMDAREKSSKKTSHQVIVH